jgi:glycosyltransferase involved in cell wall biosynthesis
LIKEEHIEIIHSHKRYSHLLGKLLAKQFKIPHITSYHSDIVGKNYLTVFGDQTICCSNAVKNLLIKKYGCKDDKSQTIYIGISPFRTLTDSEKKKTLKKIGIEENKLIISSVSQFIPAKDKETLLYSINELRKIRDISNLVFVLLGYGKQKKYLENLVTNLKIKENVIFVDGIFDVESLMNISEFMILTSINEGFGIVLLEAASIGKIHIGTNVGGIPEFINDNETGLLIEPKNPKQLAKSIAFLLDNPLELLRMGSSAKMKYENEFTFEPMLNKIIKVYQSIYANNIHISG